MDSKRKLSATDCEKITRLLESGALDNIQLALSLLEQTADHDDIVKIFHLGVIVDLVCLDQPEDVEAMIHVGHFLQKTCPQVWQRFTEAVVDDQLLTSQFYEQPPQNKYSGFGGRAISSTVAGKLAFDQWSDYVESVGFNGLERLTAGQAKGLVKFSGKLTFDSIAELTDDAADILSQHKGELSLRALENVSESAIRSLSQHANLKVSKKINAKIRAYISSEKAKFRKSNKSGKSVLTKQQMTKIRKLLRGKTSAQIRMAIELVGTAGASADDVVEIFSTSIISLLVNTWDINIWNSVAPLLEKYVVVRNDFVDLVDRRFLKKSVDHRLSFINALFTRAEMPLVPLIKESRIFHGLPTTGWVRPLYNLTELSDAGAQLFVLAGDTLFNLPGLTRLSDAAAESLSKHESDLDLDGLTSLSDAAAESLSKHEGYLCLGGLAELSDAAAASLSKIKGDLYLSIDKLPVSAAKIIRDA